MRQTLSGRRSVPLGITRIIRASISNLIAYRSMVGLFFAHRFLRKIRHKQTYLLYGMSLTAHAFFFCSKKLRASPSRRKGEGAKASVFLRIFPLPAYRRVIPRDRYAPKFPQNRPCVYYPTLGVSHGLQAQPVFYWKRKS